MIFPLLSYFNNISGPRILLKAPELRTSIHLDHIPLLMDLYREGFFIHEYGPIRTINLLFEIYSPLARGNVEFIMVSLICFEKQYNLSSFKEIMEFFVVELQNIPEVYKGFHCESEKFGAKEKYYEIVNLFDSFNQSLPKEKAIIKQNANKIFTYGLSQTGKKNILKCLQENLLQAKFGNNRNPSILGKL